MKFRRRGFIPVLVILFAGILCLHASPIAIDTNLQIRLVMDTTDVSGSSSVRIAKDPRNNILYYLKNNGDIFQVDLEPGAGSSSMRVYSAADHGISGAAEGLAIGPDGTIYLIGSVITGGGYSLVATIMKGVPDTNGVRVWSMLAQTQPYPFGRTAFDHLMSGLVVSPDGNWLYLNSGSRTDHGEVESAGGVYPNVRDVALTAKIFRLPANGANLILTNDLATLKSAGYVYAEGTRNAFDMAFAPNGDLFATDNGPDRDMSDELNWIRPGLHYGFPWRMGAADNPQQFPDYNPTNDLLLNPEFIGVATGTYQNDPAFPPPPTNFYDPVINLGPDADEYRDPVDGTIQDASDLGQTISTFTAHSSPLGLVFDTTAQMAPPYQGHGFMLRWTQGDPLGDSLAGPFDDASEDMVDLNLTPLGTNYSARVTSIVEGFGNPIDAEVIGNKVYVIEYGGNEGIWEVIFPPVRATLNIAAAGAQIVVSWSVAGTLQWANDLGPGALWQAVGGAPNTVTGGSYTNTVGAGAIFYRLAQ